MLYKSVLDRQKNNIFLVEPEIFVPYIIDLILQEKGTHNHKDRDGELGGDKDLAQDQADGGAQHGLQPNVSGNLISIDPGTYTIQVQLQRPGIAPITQTKQIRVDP